MQHAMMAAAFLGAMTCGVAPPATGHAQGRAAPGAWFDASGDPRKLQTFPVEGLKSLACGTVYPAAGLEQGGMPLGGIGTGYLCVDADGRFGKCSIFNRLPAPMRLGQPLLSVELNPDQGPRKPGETTSRLRRAVLAADNGGVGDAKAIHYFGHFPVADVRFQTDLPVRVELRAYSPFLPGDSAGSNVPAAVFLVRLLNTSDKRQRGSVVFSPGGFPAGTSERFAPAQGWAAVEVAHKPLDRLPASVRSTYAIAVENGSAETDKAGVCVRAPFDLAPGQATVARFVLAWHQPFLREGSGRVEKHKYAERFADAKSVAAEAVARHQQWLKRILAWQDVLYAAELPDWLKEELVNVPYTLTKNSVWLARTRPDDWWGKEGLFLVNESFATCSVCETMPCRFFGHWPALFFFPDLELTTLKAIRYFQLRGGEPPFCLGVGFAIRDPRYHCQHTCGAGEYAQMIYRHYLRTGDERFLKDFWESARDSLNFMLWLDRDGDGLIEDHSHAAEGETFPANNPLDNWPWYGASSYTAGKGLASLVCGIKMAEHVGDESQAARWRAVLKKGQAAYEAKLWTGDFYRTYHDTATGRRNDSCFAAQLSGVWCTRVLGLEDPLPKDRVQRALDSIARLNIPASPFGMMDAVFADGKPCIEGGPGGDRIWSRDIFIQCNATAAMVYYYSGRRAEGEKAARPMLDTIFRGPHAMPWSQPCGLNSVTGGTCHGHDYYDHMVVWSYPLALAGHDIRAACAKGGLIARILEAANP